MQIEIEDKIKDKDVPIIPKIGPSTMTPPIFTDNAIIVPNRTILFFSIPRNFEFNIRTIVEGIG